MTARFSKTVSLLLLSFLPAFCLTSVAAEPGDDGRKQKLPEPKITISKQTTHILKPVGNDGYIDYIEAINQRLGKGVTPRNNAAIVICRLLGPSGGELRENKEYREALFKRLGVAVPPANGDYFVSITELAESAAAKANPPGNVGELAQTFFDQQSKAIKGPWSKADLPRIAEWIEKNEKPLAELADGMRRERYFLPLIAEEEPRMLIDVLLPVVQSTRELARLLKARAMLRLQEGDAEKAWQDMATCHRLARHVSQGPTLIERLVGIAIESIALDGDLTIAGSDRLSSKQTLAFRKRLESLPPLPRIVEAVDTTERFMFLDAISHLARGSTGVTEMMGVADGSAGATLTKLLSAALIDWDEPMKIANQWYDKIVAGARKPTFRERMAAADKLVDDLDEFIESGKNPTALAARILLGGSPRKAVGQQIGKVLIAMLLPAITSVGQAETRADTQFDLTRVALALAAYKKDKDSYPDALDQLAPKYIDKLPSDFYVARPLTYKPSQDGYILYALGPNGQDDNGLGPYYKPNDGDDIAIHVPRPKEDD